MDGGCTGAGCSLRKLMTVAELPHRPAGRRVENLVRPVLQVRPCLLQVRLHARPAGCGSRTGYRHAGSCRLRQREPAQSCTEVEFSWRFL